jgi:hypothetical protein
LFFTWEPFWTKLSSPVNQGLPIQSIFNVIHQYCQFFLAKTFEWNKTGKDQFQRLWMAVKFWRKVEIRLIKLVDLTSPKMNLLKTEKTKPTWKTKCKNKTVLHVVCCLN